MKYTTISGLTTIILLGFTITSVSALYGDLIVNASIEKNPLQVGEFPVVVGTITDQNGKPITTALVKITSPEWTIWTVPDSNGNFRYEFTKAAKEGNYTVNILVTKNEYGNGIYTLEYSVHSFGTQSNEIPPIDPNELIAAVGDNLVYNPVSLTIQELIEQGKYQLAEQLQQQENIERQKQFVEEQRKISYIQLKNDTEETSVEIIETDPRAIFEKFVLQVDETVRNVFWGQFNFTEQLTNEAADAKMKVLENGGSIEEARKAYHEKAASSRGKILKLNEDLNLKYGLVNNTSPDPLDEKKVPVTIKNNKRS
ncbi:MAG: carboxypeptidase-like regulatory domain-containing protein [Nitrosopumilaceae archaeon]